MSEETDTKPLTPVTEGMDVFDYLRWTDRDLTWLEGAAAMTGNNALGSKVHDMRRKLKALRIWYGQQPTE